MSSAFNLNEFLSKAHKAKASDVHLKEGKIPSIRVEGRILKIMQDPLTERDFENIFKTIAKKDILEALSKCSNLDFTYEIEGLSRYRVNYCRDLGLPKLTFRAIPYDIPTLKDLYLPPCLREFTTFNNGIILVTGPTGSGKSTTLASIIDIINKEQQKHIITIEDPVEFLYSDKKSLITQRGLGVDTESFASGIKYALRQDPDVILVGEIRDKITLESAIEASETGHLVLSTLHTNSCIQTINRIMGFFEDKSSSLIIQRLMSSLRATISQKLLPKKEGGLTPAVEIMTATPTVTDYLNKHNFDEVYQLMQKSKQPNMITMNASIYGLFKQGLITEEIAMEYSDNRLELQQMIKGMFHGTNVQGNNLI